MLSTQQQQKNTRNASLNHILPEPVTPRFKRPFQQSPDRTTKEGTAPAARTNGPYMAALNQARSPPKIMAF